MLKIDTRPRRQNSHKADFWKRAPSFLQWLRGRPCMLADKGGCGGKIEAAHVDYAGDKGVGTKVSDCHSVPLCSEHHAAQHSWGWDTFEAHFKLGLGDTLRAAAEYWKAWPGRKAWEEGRRDG